jgi:hypothetical protein
MLDKRPPHKVRVGDVSDDELSVLYEVAVPSCQVIEHNTLYAVVDERAHSVRTDVASPSSDENGHCSIPDV